MSKLPSILEITKTYPSAYLGHGEGDYYARLVGFISGYSQGARQSAGDSSLHALPAGFNDFVKTTLNGRHQPPRYGADDHWIDMIRKEAGSDDAAFKLFYEMWESFNQVHAA